MSATVQMDSPVLNRKNRPWIFWCTALGAVILLGAFWVLFPSRGGTWSILTGSLMVVFLGSYAYIKSSVNVREKNDNGRQPPYQLASWTKGAFWFLVILTGLLMLFVGPPERGACLFCKSDFSRQQVTKALPPPPVTVNTEPTIETPPAVTSSPKATTTTLKTPPTTTITKTTTTEEKIPDTVPKEQAPPPPNPVPVPDPDPQPGPFVDPPPAGTDQTKIEPGGTDQTQTGSNPPPGDGVTIVDGRPVTQLKPRSG